MLVGYAFVVGFTILEARLGIRLPTSRLLTAVTSQTYAVTSVFHNQNDLATYIALCWPFMLCAFFFTRRLRWLGARRCSSWPSARAAFVRTGSRSSLVAVGISSLAAVVLFWHLGPRLSSRDRQGRDGRSDRGPARRRGWLLFNDSSNDMLRQFRLEALLGQAGSEQGLGPIRTSLTRPRPADRRRAPSRRRPGPGRGHHRVGHRRPRHRQPAQLVARDVRGRRTRRLRAAPRLLRAAGGRSLADRPARPRPVDALPGRGDGRWRCSASTIGAVGPSSSVSFAPMWILYGLGLAVISRVTAGRGAPGAAAAAVAWRHRRLVRAAENGREGPGRLAPLPVAGYRSPSLRPRADPRAAGARRDGCDVLSPTPWVPRVFWRDPRHRRRGQKPRRATRDGIVADYPRVLQLPRRLLFDRLGDIAYRRIRPLPSVRAGGATSCTRTRRCRTARSRSGSRPTSAYRSSSPCTAPTSTSTSRWAAPSSAAPRACSAAPTPSWPTRAPSPACWTAS